MTTDDPKLQRVIVNDISDKISCMDLDISPAVLSMPVYTGVMEHTGCDDPYREQKKQQNKMALALEEDMRALVRQSDDALLAALHLAAAGNIIDLGTMQEKDINLAATIEQVMRESFAVDHSEAFRASLSQCKDLLFLLDNAGEIVFDKILIEELSKCTKVTAVVKARPIINDVTMVDAEDVGLTKVCEVIDNGGGFIGSPLELVPKTFLERMHRADMIVGKGHGNYETIDEFPGDVFLILRAKCVVVAQHMGINMGQVGLVSTRQRAQICGASQ
jgi:uncharacterized protein with ATP-grasp and redox domains